MAKTALVSALVVGLLVTVVFACAAQGAPVQGNSISSVSQKKAPAFISHRANDADITQLKSRVGVLDPAKDYSVNIGPYTTGVSPPSEADYADMLGEAVVVTGVAPGTQVAASADLSTSPYFPPIGNQGGLPSCSGYAMSYYMNTYLQAKDYGWTDISTNDAHVMSQAWGYNFANYGSSGGSNPYNVAKTIRTVGNAPLSLMPYSGSTFPPTNYQSLGDENAWRAAPLYRAENVYIILPPLDDAAVTSAKAAISNGYLVGLGLDADPTLSNTALLVDNTVESYEIGAEIDHYVTMVGYDDSKTGMSGSETGAFKCANSWGTSWSGDGGGGGYFWITYQAVKKQNYHLVWIDDKADYNPSMLATWQFSSNPARDCPVELGLGPYGSPVQTRAPSWNITSGPTSLQMPSFMCLDISEFSANWSAGTNDFYLSIGSGSYAGTISTFKIERYSGTYTPGSPANVSSNSMDCPKNTPGYVTVNLAGLPPKYFFKGYVTNETGAAVPNATVNFVDLQSFSGANVTADEYGYYEFDLQTLAGGFSIGDTINVTANATGYLGWNETTADALSGEKMVNVTVFTTNVPFFSCVPCAVAVAGALMGIVAVAARRKREENKK